MRLGICMAVKYIQLNYYDSGRNIMNDISISIVTYNNSRNIEKALISIISNMNSTLNYTIYAVDNNSSDNTVDIIKKVPGNIVLIQNSKNVGFGAGHNQVLGLIDSKYHIIANPDIEIENNCLFEFYRFMDENAQIGLLTPLIKYPDGNIQYLCKRNPTCLDLLIRLLFPSLLKQRQDYYTMKETLYNKEFEVEYATGCFMFFRTEILKKIKGFDDNIFLYLEDADITRRVNQISRTVFYPYNYVLHEWQKGSHKDFRLMWINIMSAVHYFKKWGFKLY
jgi:GT2 family glycosyltransferase